MRLSRHTIFIPDFPRPEQWLVYHTRTRAQVVIDRTLKEALDGLAAGGGAPAETLSALLGMGILVEDGTDEDRLLEEWFRRIREDDSRLQVSVLTTYRCNFACPYCVEEGVRGGESMTPRTAHRVVEYLRRRVDQETPRELALGFSGGEPLLNLEALRIVAGGVQALAREGGLELTVTMTTNGSLLDPALVEELRGYGLRRVKITLDGAPEYHDRSRPFSDGRGSFERVLANTAAAAERLEVQVGGNFDLDSLPGFPPLLDRLAEMGLAPKLWAVDFKPIIRTAHERERAAPTADLGCSHLEPGMLQAMLDLRRAALERGFRTSPGVGVNLCSMVLNRSTFVIDPRGEIYRCPAFAGRRQFASGHIDRPGEEDFSTRELWRRCGDCPFVPLCGDGCLYAAYVRYGDPDRLLCPREFMETAVRENLKLSYRYGRKGIPG